MTFVSFFFSVGVRYGGISLYQMIKDKKVPNKEWFKILFDKISLIHLVGVAHNDLHCKNIVGDGEEKLFLIDLGLAKICDTDIDEDTGNFLEFIESFFFKFLFIFSSNINTLAKWFT
jgi:tRNA A-37 threonylcarbamoyl transferase component Bud32